MNTIIILKCSERHHKRIKPSYHLEIVLSCGVTLRMHTPFCAIPFKLLYVSLTSYFCIRNDLFRSCCSNFISLLFHLNMPFAIEMLGTRTFLMAMNKNILDQKKRTWSYIYQKIAHREHQKLREKFKIGENHRVARKSIIIERLHGDRDDLTAAFYNSFRCSPHTP